MRNNQACQHRAGSHQYFQTLSKLIELDFNSKQRHSPCILLELISVDLEE